jgi:class 3 adenylate cyclase
MNLFFKSYRVCLIFFLLITCETCTSWGLAQDSKLQITPWIQEINLPSQYKEIPNQTFFRDHHGVLFIGKENGLNIIDGRQLSYFHMEGPVYVAGEASDTLYYVARNDLGFLVRQEDGLFRSISRIHLIPVPKRNFTPSGIHIQSGQVFIYTDTGCFQFSGSEINFLERDSDLLVQFPPDTTVDRVFLEMIGSKIGIPANGIRQVFTWNNSEIWILGAYSLHQIYSSSPLSFLDIETKHTGRILSSMVGNDRILLGTSQGIFSISKEQAGKDHWSMVDLLPESKPSIHFFSAINDRVFAAGSDGLYMISEHHAEIIDKCSFTGILAIRRGTILASDQDGVVRYRQSREGWQPSLLDASFPYSHSFTTYNNNTFFLCKNAVFRINSRANRISPVPFRSNELLYRLMKVGQNLFLIGSQRIYRYDRNEEIFHPLPESYRSELFSKSDIIHPAGNGKFWILQKSDDYLSRVLYKSNLDEPIATNAAFPVLQNLGVVLDLAYSDSVLILTGKERIAFFDLRKLEGKPGKVSIRLQESGPGGSVDGFHISGFELQRMPEPLFRYRVLPKEEAWSGWNSRRDYRVPGLEHGKYRVEVQAMDLFGRISDANQVSFAIPPPFYAAWYAFLVYGILLLALLFLFQKWRLFSFNRAESRITERMEIKMSNLAAEKERSDKLVAEILPEETANQIKSKGKASWDKYERATVLFSDIEGFTRIAEEMNPEKLIDELDSFFFHFDSVVEKYNIEKIKTIGDAYMAAGGIPQRNSTNPVEVVMAALEMQAYMQKLKSSTAEIWDLRIGIHTGPVIAGVVGHKKISYDIWGDTVNTASRMESSGTPGKINISGITYGMVKDYFLCEYRGKLPVKYKGNIDMYYVNGLRPELAVDLKGIPNRRFYLQLQLLRLGDLEDIVFNEIISKLPESLHFHGLEYVRRVYNQSFLLCRSEEIEQEDRLLARTAALMLFTGLSQEYYNFENRSAVICREILPEYSYSEKQIDQICNLILATKMPFNPKNPLEKVLIDARMEYIGRPDFTSLSKLLYQELKEAGAKINGQQFKKQQQELLYNFEFYTIAAKRLREVSGNDQMTTLEQERWI